MTNINENICQAIDIIIQERLSHISFDSTILCKIVDDSKKEQGVYVVKSDEVRFEAYSTLNTLVVGDSVYVQIPNGDWNEQKFILSKKTLSDENPSLTYKNPFANFIDITGNLISDAQATDYGLIANSSNETIKIWEYNVAEQEEPLKGYTTLGLKAGFKTLLNPFFYGEEGETKKSSNVTKGDYGLRLTIISKLENLVKKPDEKENEQEIVKVAKYTLELNEENMNGNPYNFSTYSNQEIIFDIGQIDNILTMSLEFYQKPTSFTDNNGIQIPESVKANLLVNNVGVYLGYRVDEINEEKVLIYSNDSSTYSAEAVDKTANNKKVRLRWIYKDAVSGSFRSVQPSDGMNFEVRWYRYRLGMPPADEYSGIYWMPLSKQTYDVDNKKYIYEVQDEDWLGQYAGVKPDFLTSWIFSDTEQLIEKVKAVILYNGQVYRSEILEFTNEKEVYSNDGILDEVEDMLDEALKDLDDKFKDLTALSIYCLDDSYGNYFIYDEDYKLIDRAQSAIPRQFIAYLNLKEGENQKVDASYEIDNATQVKWYIPTSRTLISFKDAFDQDTENKESKISYYQGQAYYTITKKAGEGKPAHNSLTYYINNNYNHNYSNNTILCEVTISGASEDAEDIVFMSAKTLSFGVSGSNGTDVKLVLDFTSPGVNGLNLSDNLQQAVKVRAFLYDQTGMDITDQTSKTGTCQWNWELINSYDASGIPQYTQYLNIISTLESCTISTISNQENPIDNKDILNTWNVLKCTLKGWGAYDLEAYLPIPVYQNGNELRQEINIPEEEQIDYFKNIIQPIENYEYINLNENLAWPKCYKTSDFNIILNSSGNISWNVKATHSIKDTEYSIVNNDNCLVTFTKNYPVIINYSNDSFEIRQRTHNTETFSFGILNTNTFKSKKYRLKFSLKTLPPSSVDEEIHAYLKASYEDALKERYREKYPNIPEEIVSNISYSLSMTSGLRIMMKCPQGFTYIDKDGKEQSLQTVNLLNYLNSHVFTFGELGDSTYVHSKSEKISTEWKEFYWDLDFSNDGKIFPNTDNGTFYIQILGGTSVGDIAPFAIKDLELVQLTEIKETALTPIALTGTTEVLYTTEGLPQYNRGLYGLHYFDYNSEHQYYNYEVDENNNPIISWNIARVGEKDENGFISLKYTDPSLRKEEGSKEIDGTTITYTTGYSLAPCEFYDPNSTDHIIVQAILNSFNAETNETDQTTLWSQPILILQNTYFSSSINNWGGEVKVDENGGMVAAPKIAAGIKTKDNRLTGVILGDYETKTNELQTGLYGFRDGETTFGFRADGTAFIGQSGAGRIDFDGEHSIIKSSSWDLVDVNNPIGEAAGTLFDLDNGLIKIQRNAKVITKDDEGNENEEIKSYLIKLDSSTTFGEDTYPFTIGEKFKVKWDGTLEATGGTFSGNITAKDGYIGKWIINENGLTNGNVHLWHEEDGKQYAFYSNNFKVTSGGSVTANDITVTNGKIQGTSSIQLQGQTVSIKATNGKGLIIDKDGARFTGDITMGPNTTISWNQISDKDWVEDELDTALDNANTALDNANTALDNASTALDTSDDALQNLKNLVLGLGVDIDGVSSTNSFIDQTFIYSPTLISPIISTNDLYINPKSVTDSGSLIFRGYNSNGTKTYDAFICEHEWNGGYPILTLSTSAAYTYFGSENTSFMTIRSGNTIIFDALTIDFNDCEIENLNVIPVFG